MHLLIKLLLLVIVCLSHDVISESTDFNTSVIPILKDATTSLPKISWSFQLPQSDGELFYLIDLDAPFTWKNVTITITDIPCDAADGCRLPLSCDNPLCKEAQSYINPTCPSLNITANYNCSMCASTPFNPISKTCELSQLTTEMVRIHTTNGRNPSHQFSGYPMGDISFVLSCAPDSLLKSFPEYVRGVASFSWSSLGFPRQVYNPNQVAKFALCLPSSSSPGVSFLGEGPFYFTSLPNVDLRSTLSYTPMIRKNSKSLGYYIKVNKISIKGTPVLSKSVSVKLSTVEPYTILRSDIYESLIASFSNATKNIPSVTHVKPFTVCLKASAIESVPNIDLETESGKIWTISKDNLMKDSGNGASCLAFIDGGSSVKDEIVIGTFQMENNFLFFDLVNQKLGFSSSLLPRGTSCNSFNFTEISQGHYDI